MKIAMVKEIWSMKKKSKFRHIQIDKKKYYFYEITWVDPTGDSGWADAKTFGKMTCSNVITSAYVFKKDKKHLWTFGSYDTSEQSFSDRNVFPIGCIVSMVKIEV